MNEQEIKNKLLEISYKEKINGKRIYPLSDFLKEFGFEKLESYVDDVCAVKVKLDKISYPTKQMFRIYLTKNKIEKVDVNAIGLMFVMAQISKTSKNSKEAKKAYEISKAICNAAKVFYPEKRVILRREYVYVTKELRGLVKQRCESELNADLKASLKKLYSTILSDYYYITDTYYLRMKKTGKPNGNYLDFITASELQDLIEIQKQVVHCLKNYPTENPLYLANRLASEKRLDFCTHHAGCFPFNYAPHTLKPARAYKEFNNLLKEYNLDAKSLKNDDDNLEKQV